MTSPKRLATLLVAALCLSMAPTALAQEIQEGAWINLFDGETLYGWTQFGDAEWKAEEGAIKCREGNSGFLASTCRFTDFDLSAKIKVSSQGTIGLVLRSCLEAHSAMIGAPQILLSEEKYGSDVLDLQVRVMGKEVTATVNGKAIEGLSACCPRGHIKLEYHRYHGHRRGPKVEVTEMKLRPLSLKPLFNGKDLSGWNIIPDHASKFSVLDGAINIKDGNGQIETAGVYQDFVLQLDIISNGEHLNSGVFFRGPVGVFWKGYESQVRNQWQGDDREKPVDFGTGGLYGVDPARKVVSTDHEWFQKTVVCEGNHMAVWINGYQVSDFYDTRPIMDNGDGKNGFVPAAGTIHLQGHDPTTDLSFKNINIQEYPAACCAAKKAAACPAAASCAAAK